MSVQAEGYITHPEYLEGEKLSPIQHEYVQGRVYAMSGASDAHNAVALNLATLIKDRLRGSRRREFIESKKVRIEAADVYYYPDVFVTCDAQDRPSTHVKRHLILIIEVLSYKTERLDRGLKFAHYGQIPALQEYVLLSQDQQRVETYHRQADGAWLRRAWKSGEQLHLESIGLRCSLESVYEDVDLSLSE